jgi:hypothetical protein
VCRSEDKAAAGAGSSPAQCTVRGSVHAGLFESNLEEFTSLRRTPPAAALAMQYLYLSNAPS